MNCLKNISYLLFLLIVSTSLTGCFPNESVYMKTGDTKSFRANGPAMSENLKYSWTIERYYNDSYSPVSEYPEINGNTFNFKANSDGEGTNLIRIGCTLMMNELRRICNTGGCYWDRVWEAKETWYWSIRITPATQTSIWQGDYYIANQKDSQVLDGVSEITGDLIIDGVSEIAGDLVIGGRRPNSGIALVIKNGENLKNLDSLNNITSIGGDLLIRENNTLSSLNGLSKITSIGGDIRIGSDSSIYSGYYNSLTSLEGLNNITSIGYDLSIRGNTSLTSLEGLSSNLTSIGGDLEIRYNDNLTSLDGLSNISSIGGGLTIKLNDGLTNLEGLSSDLTSIGGSLEISGNNGLTSLDGLSNITSIGGGLKLEANNALTSLEGLSNLCSVFGVIMMVRNSELCTNLAQELIDQVLSCDPDGTSGAITIENNKECP